MVPTQEKEPRFLPSSSLPGRWHIFHSYFSHAISAHTGEFFNKKGSQFKVLWKIFHIIRSLTHYTDVSACLYKDLEQSVLATELTSKLFDLKFFYFDNVIMHLTQGHCYSLTYRKLSEEKLSNTYSREMQFEVISWTPKQIHYKYLLFYGHASFLVCRVQEDLKYETIPTDHLKTRFCYWEESSENAKRKKLWKYTIWFNIMKHEWGLNFLSSILSVKVGIQTNQSKLCYFQIILFAKILTKASMLCSFSKPGRDPSRSSENAGVQKFTCYLHFNTLG